jgi:hypothetical protein
MKLKSRMALAVIIVAFGGVAYAGIAARSPPATGRWRREWDSNPRCP